MDSGNNKAKITYYEQEGVPIKLDHGKGWPEKFNGKEWSPVAGSDYGRFAHGADEITKAEFDKLVAHRTHEHAQHTSGVRH
jgi:hypothetical protein